VVGGTPAAVAGAELGAMSGNRPVALPGLITVVLVPTEGSVIGATVPGFHVPGATVPVPTVLVPDVPVLDVPVLGDLVVGVVVGADLVAEGLVVGLAEVWVGVGLGFDVTGGAVSAIEPAAAGRVVIAGLEAACAVAVSVTPLTEESPAGTVIAACMVNDSGVVLVSSCPRVQVAAPSALGQSAVNTASCPEGAAESVTDVLGTGPSGAETCTVNTAAWPRSTLASDHDTLTHSVPADELDDAEESLAAGTAWQSAVGADENACSSRGLLAGFPSAAAAMAKMVLSSAATARRVTMWLFVRLFTWQLPRSWCLLA